ncbi:hypothetical protein SKAU_G00172020 [Synaphobranchus kaupii]|uniref:Uncharacterized protein n=1 Tax=Synaphobranchus kaupii TaxID=118154 RepID=A0A9Q1J0Y3_SYNKA|nr:hypothetical protein SKAU_G00172020 [Synaphobranchus kaupii]
MTDRTQNMAHNNQQSTPRRGKWIFSSVRIRSKTPGEDAGLGFWQRRTTIFSSLRVDPRKSESLIRSL